MVSLLTVSKAQKKLPQNLRARRLNTGLTQEGLAKRSGVSLPSLRKFEQKGIISLESFLKLLMVLDALESVVKATLPEQTEFSSIDEVLETNKRPTRKKGWRK
ncbi:MAG: helix-turn-helix transcriptional regulator [Sedimenticola sp.]